MEIFIMRNEGEALNNQKITVEGTTLRIDVDLTAKPIVSETGKLIVISTTVANQK